MTDRFKIEGELIKCVRCDTDLTEAARYHMCDNAGAFCNDCWEANDGRIDDLCLMVHGEGCHTAVFKLEESK